MSANNYHLGLINYASLLIRGLKHINAPVEVIISKSLIKNFNTKKCNNYIPLHVIYNFFETTCKHFKDVTIPFGVLKYFQFSNLGYIGEYVSSSNILLDFLQKLSKYDFCLSTNQNIELNIIENKTILSYEILGTSRLGKTILEKIWLTMIIWELNNGFNTIIHPLKIEANTRFKKHNLLLGLNTKKITYSDKNGVRLYFNSSQLTIKKQVRPNSTINESDLPRPEPSLTLMIKSLLENSKGEHLPTLDLMAKNFDVSIATFKRKLLKEDNRYKEIINDWRFFKAIELLINKDKQINKISKELYYSNTANFCRAFKRWTGHTPSNFKANDT